MVALFAAMPNQANSHKQMLERSFMTVRCGEILRSIAARQMDVCCGGRRRIYQWGVVFALEIKGGCVKISVHA